jgi:hypothetical protein
VLKCEWIWSKNKFMDRKVDMTEIYLDFLDDGVINRDKFKVNNHFCLITNQI